LELANYHILGRILYYVPYYSPLHPGRVFSTFAFLSALVESLNGWGASYSANQKLPQSQQDIGHALMKTALLLQLFVAISFVYLAVFFHMRCRRNGIRNRRVEGPLLTLYVSTAIITVRTIYRTVEYFGVASLRYGPGFDPNTITPVVRYEWFFYVFEASLMLINCVLFNFRHPRRWLPESNKTYLAQDGVTEIEGPGWEDPRPFWVTALDPFDIMGTVRGRSSQSHRFWENNGFEHATPNGSHKAEPQSQA
jgi:RTA1 like protein